MLLIGKHINKYNCINLLLSFIPISFILGNLAINLNVLLIIILSLFFFRLEVFTFKIFLFDKLLISLFCFILITGFVNSLIHYEAGDISSSKKIIMKSLFFLRYLIFYSVIRFFIEKQIFNFRYFLFTASFCALFVSLDVILQFFYGKDIFGYAVSNYKLSGPFGDELIAGAYIQRFSIFIFFLISFFFKFKNKNIKVLTLFCLFILIFFSIVITGNRMPTLLFILLFSLIFLVEKKLRLYSYIFIPIVLMVFFFIYNLIPFVQVFTISLFTRITEFYTFFVEIFIYGSEPKITNTYLNEFNSGYLVWKLNPFIGGGLGSFYINCTKILPLCNSHPHNFYLEILSELGIFGFSLIIFILIKLLQILYIKRIYIETNTLNRLLTPFLLLLIVEIFPIKTSGSFFTTTNATFIFFLLAVNMGLSRLVTIDLNNKNN